MPIVYVALVIIVAGIALYLVNAYVPMQAQVKNLLNVVVVCLLALWVVLLLLNEFGAGPSIG